MRISNITQLINDSYLSVMTKQSGACLNNVSCVQKMRLCCLFLSRVY